MNPLAHKEVKAMLIKAGVDISRLNREIRRALNPLSRLYKSEGEELVITSTYEGNHMPSSLHYHNDAIDIRWPKSNVTTRDQIARKIRDLLGPQYDVVPERDHIHIEFDPKGGVRC